jgi:hypothetical protein
MAYEARRKGNTSLLIIIGDRVPGVETLVPGLKSLGVFDDVIAVKSYSLFTRFRKNIGTFNYLFNRRGALEKLFERENNIIESKHGFITNSQINLFHVVRTRAYFLIKYPDNYFRMVEEGFSTYMHKMPLSRYLKRRYLIRFPILMGYDKQVKEVLVQHPERLKDPVLRRKAVKFELAQLQEALLPEEKKDILECFLKGKVDYAARKKFLVITQPLSEDKIISEETKIAIYRKAIMTAAGKGYTVYLKTHPRELTKYDAIFQNIRMIPQLFPIEILNLSDEFFFEAGFTVFSGSLENIKHVGHKIFLGRDILKTPEDFLNRDLELMNS